MPNEPLKITELTEVVSPASSDVLPIVSGALTKKVTVANLTAAEAAARIAADATLQPLDADLTAIAALTPTNDDVIQRKAGAWANRTPAQLKTDLVLVKADVGLGNVDNVSDANKPVSTATQTALDLKAALASPVLTGTPTAPTAVNATDTTQIATTQFVHALITALLNSAPANLDTLGEIAIALEDSEDELAALITIVSGKLAKASNLSDLVDAATARTNLGVPEGSGTSTGSNTGDQAIPVKATGAEITAGIDDEKFATPLAVADSNIVRESDSPEFSGTVGLPHTTGATVGVELKGGSRFVHNFTNAHALAAEVPANGADAYNTFLGVQAGNFTSSGSVGTALGGRNVAIGFKAGSSNTTGWQNTAVGFISQQKNTTGQYNTSVGAYALVENTTGLSNTAIGSDALWKNTTGYNNTAVGTYSLQQTTTGSDNVAVGVGALRLATTGSGNTAVGVSAMDAQTTGPDNVAIGKGALRASQTGANNVAVGVEALRTTTAGQLNTAVGAYSLFALTSGTQNVAAGFGSAESLTTGADNVAVGHFSADLLTTGANNVMLGKSAGANVTTGSNNIIIGKSINADSATGNNQLNIGGKIKGDLSTGDISIVGSIRSNAVAFSALPATPVEGMIVPVTDSSTATWGDTITGGGANHVLAYFNGTNWTVMAK